MSTQSTLGDRRQCPFCGGSISNVKVPQHIAEDCDDAPREVSP